MWGALPWRESLVSERVLALTLTLALGAGVAGLTDRAGLAGRSATERTRSATYDDDGLPVGVTFDRSGESIRFNEGSVQLEHSF